MPIDYAGFFTQMASNFVRLVGDQSPVVQSIILLAFAAVGASVYQRIRWAHLALAPRDPVRRFPSQARRVITDRAGNRCEHHFLWMLRCPTTTNLEADHVHPHSRGGSTTVGNGQALCRSHNRSKGARVPFTWELRLLERRRGRYAPAGADVRVRRRQS